MIIYLRLARPSKRVSGAFLFLFFNRVDNSINRCSFPTVYCTYDTIASPLKHLAAGWP